MRILRWPVTICLLGLLSYAGYPAHAAGGSELVKTEEAWTIKEVCDQIVFLLHPELAAQAPESGRIVATPNHAEPISYAVSEGSVKSTVTLNHPAWDPQSYQTWCRAVSTEAAQPDPPMRGEILVDLLTPDTVHFLALENRLSKQLAQAPRNPGLLTDAALLLGTIAWTEPVSHFQDIRPLLNRMTAFLAAADALGAKGKERDVAEILRLVLIHDQVAALEKITTARRGIGLPVSWLDALELSATCDWRNTETKAANGPKLLQLVHFEMLAGHMGANKAESFFKKIPAATGVEWVRGLNQARLNVVQGHQYTKILAALEIADAAVIANSYDLGGSAANKAAGAMKLLTMFDGRTSYERAPESRVLGVQFWAGQTQRHFLQGILAMHQFVNHMLGMPAEGTKIAEQAQKNFSTMYLYPFLELAIDKDHQTEAQQAGDKMAKEHPEMVTPKLWAALKPETPEGMARGTPDFHRFFNPELPRQTSFEAGKRIYEIGVGDENSLPLLKGILARCPFDYEMAFQTAIVEGRPDNVEGKKMECYTHFADTEARALEWVLFNSTGNPIKWERLMLQKASWNPDAYLELTYYFEHRNDIEKATKYLLLARDKVDAVSFSTRCGFLVKNYARTGRLNEAEELAKTAADTYSTLGLETMAWLKEFRKQWPEAAQVNRALDERYGNGDFFYTMSYVVRRKLSGEGWQPEYQTLLDGVFPKGLGKASLQDFGQKAPSVGARFKASNKTLQEAGIEPTDVIVALDGIRVDNMKQYIAIQRASENPDMSFIVWDGKEYTELKTHLPGRRFGLEVLDYKN